MTAEPAGAEILRRHFVAIATSAYDDPLQPPLPQVHDEVRTLAEWFCDAELGERRFTWQYPELADNPTDEQIRAAMKNPPPARKWREADAAVVFVTGHGKTDRYGHWLILQHTNPDAPQSTGLLTAQIAGWLDETRIEHLLLIIDTCYAGEVTSDIVRFPRELRRNWLVLASAARDEAAQAGALTSAVRRVLDDVQGRYGQRFGTDEYLPVEEFVRAVDRELAGTQRLVLVQGSQYQGPHACLPNPNWKASFAPTGPPRRDLAMPLADLQSHWKPRLRGSDQGWLPTGRAAVMRRLITATAEPGAVLVTGRAGTGKSAVLARLVTLSDPEFRRRYADKIAHIPDDLRPAEGAVDVAVLAMRKSAAEIMTQICHATGALDASVRNPSLSEAETAWRRWLSQGTEPVTIVIDALDEASKPDEVLADVLAELNVDSGPRRLRLIVGVRSVGRDRGGTPPGADAGTPDNDNEELPLADRVQRALGIEAHGRIQADEPPWWVQQDLVDYVTGLLGLPSRSPYRSAEPGKVQAIAGVLAEHAGKSFLFARLAAEQLASRSGIVDIDDPDWLASISHGVLGLFREDLHRSLPSQAERKKAVDLLRAVAFAFGPGLPWGSVWPKVASAVSGVRTYGDGDIAWLLNTRLGGYLVADRADGITVYRLHHEDLRTILRDHSTELLAP